MKNFLFIVPLTPFEYRTPLRQELYELFLSALRNQKYTGWQALLIGEVEKNDGNFIYRRIEASAKEIKLMYAYEYVSTLSEKPDYIIRLDDDDLISPDILESIASSSDSFDCYADKYHSYYDVVSGEVCSVINPWLPNTVVHRTDHAINLFSLDETPLFLLDHSKYWMEYYKHKRICWADKNSPVYLRVMSPTAGTSNMHKMKILDFTDEVLRKYNDNVKFIGNWQRNFPGPFAEYIDRLRTAWKKVSGKEPLVFQRKKNIFFKWLQR